MFVMKYEDFKYHYIYKTINKLNGMEYIGIHSTNDIDDGYLGSGLYLNHAIKKYGKENFEKQILEFCNTREEVLNREQYIVCLDYVRNNKVYNLVLGGNYPGGRNESICKFKKGEEKQLFIDFKNGLYEKNFNKDYDGPLIEFYVDNEELKKHKAEIKARREISNKYLSENIKNKRVNLGLLIEEIVSYYSICIILTNYWNDERYHSDAINMFKKLAMKGIIYFTNTSIIRLRQLKVT